MIKTLRSKIIFGSQLIQNMGLRYLTFRLSHELKRKIGILEVSHPTRKSSPVGWDLEKWRKNVPVFLVGNLQAAGKYQKNDFTQLEERIKKYLGGEVRMFNHSFEKLPATNPWLTHLKTGFQFQSDVHWSKIKDLDDKQGDIKYVWEKSRFTYLLEIIRYDYLAKTDHSAFVFDEIDSWINANPVNQGPNWVCSQEISLRVFNWLFALHFYKNSEHLTSSRWEKIQHVLYWSLHHVYHQINFSRIAVRNNHAITETLFLALSSILLPQFEESKIWSVKGRRFFEQEIAYQIYEDGTFLQFSMNYHRVVIQLLTFGINLTELYGQPFSQKVYAKAYASLNFLYRCMNHEDGFLPNYGNNDGALFFPFSDCHYRDYRPALHALHFTLTGSNLIVDSLENQDSWKEEAFWLCHNKKVSYHKFSVLTNELGTFRFDDGGYYLHKDVQTFTFLRCGNHKDRPHQCDNLHLDIWVDGENILKDAGSYTYNAPVETLDFFSGNKGHNILSINSENQMLRGGRFIWIYWTQRESVTIDETQDFWIFKGRIKAYGQIGENIMIERIVKKDKNQAHWTIEDSVINSPDKSLLSQHWNGLDRTKYQIVSQDEEGKPLTATLNTTFFSEFYGNKTEQNQISFCNYSSKIITLIFKI
ncbi:hypothetical protein GCM10008106_10080 [Mongoliitalea lutea]|uniref:Heparinase II/III N-terminus n=2 Tax=Mongoliitalea lutea TaxID=849756 RepID=A0A8J3G4I1_9BACT|nr:hypothetical protein GCM10008106_10080 [Mongoliitalea lutea]